MADKPGLITRQQTTAITCDGCEERKSALRKAESERLTAIVHYSKGLADEQTLHRETQRQLDEARALVEAASLALHSPSDDPEHDIHSHAPSLPALYRTACTSIASAQDIISGYVIDRLAAKAKEDGK